MIRASGRTAVQAMRITYFGGPTAQLEWAGARLLTDPTFDAAGEIYTTPAYTLRKTQDPAAQPSTLAHIDAVLLSHDHHFDNLDRAGRSFLERVPHVVTTKAGAARLGGAAVGLDPWETSELKVDDGRTLLVTATPARHGPPHADRGPVIGFALARPEAAKTAVYVSGDTVWFEGVQQVADRLQVVAALLFMGAARVKAAGDWPLTFTAAEGVLAARAMPDAAIVPLHYEGWEHFSESRTDIEQAFRDAKLEDRLLWLSRGQPTELSLE
jgi:L-ascorbate metabolism protein UlaG (beta-lactamase superfamily)